MNSNFLHTRIQLYILKTLHQETVIKKMVFLGEWSFVRVQKPTKKISRKQVWLIVYPNPYFIHIYMYTLNCMSTILTLGIDINQMLIGSFYLLIDRYLTMDPSKSAVACLVCGAMYQWQWALAKHFEQDHVSLPNPYQIAGDDSNERITSSPSASSSSLSSSSLSPKKNLLSPYKCSHCPYYAETKSDLTRHQIRHTLNKHHVCKVIGTFTCIFFNNYDKAEDIAVESSVPFLFFG